MLIWHVSENDLCCSWYNKLSDDDDDDVDHDDHDDVTKWAIHAIARHTVLVDFDLKSLLESSRIFHYITALLRSNLFLALSIELNAQRSGTW